MTAKRGLLFYCQHSMGMGHLVRSLALADALSREFHVTFLSGGQLPAGIAIPDAIDVVSLPPLGMGTDNRLVSWDEQYTVETAKVLRRRKILSCFAETSPDVLVIELFPFGRKKFADELFPLLDAAAMRGADRPLILCSLRDILVNARRDKSVHDDWACDNVNRHFDGVLVHADPRFSKLEETFEPGFPLTVPVHYTGFVLPRRDDDPTEARTRRVVVSAGGGIVGGPLLRAAIDAHAIVWAEDGLFMKAIAGPFLPEEEWRELETRARGREGLELVRSVPDMVPELRRATASISQCGYNTAMDVLYSGVPALVVPFCAGREDEQLNRARRLARLGALRVLEPENLNGRALADEIRRLAVFHPRHTALDLEGARNSAELVAGLAAGRRLSAAGQFSAVQEESVI